jgi:hypothetical protein
VLHLLIQVQHKPATVSVTGAGGLNLHRLIMQTTQMQEQLRLHILCGDDNHTGSNDSQDFSIGKASSTTSSNSNRCSIYLYRLAQTPATVSVTGAGGLNHTTADYANNTMQEQLRLLRRR